MKNSKKFVEKLDKREKMEENNEFFCTKLSDFRVGFINPKNIQSIFLAEYSIHFNYLLQNVYQIVFFPQKYTKLFLLENLSLFKIINRGTYKKYLFYPPLFSFEWKKYVIYLYIYLMLVINFLIFITISAVRNIRGFKGLTMVKNMRGFTL